MQCSLISNSWAKNLNKIFSRGIVENRKDEVEDEIYIDPYMQIGLTSYTYKDLPKWAKNSIKQQLIKEKMNNESKRI